MCCAYKTALVHEFVLCKCRDEWSKNREANHPLSSLCHGHMETRPCFLVLCSQRRGDEWEGESSGKLTENLEGNNLL